jgi:hypothetical protein
MKNIKIGGLRNAAVAIALAGACLVSANVHAAAAAASVVDPQYKETWADYTAQRAKAQPAKLPDWGGVWRRQLAGQGSPFLSFGDQDPTSPVLGRQYAASSAMLTPKYKAAYDKKIQEVKNGVEWDRLSNCLPVGMPRWLTEPWLREFVVTPNVTYLIHEQISEVRRIYTDGRGHRSVNETGPLWQGESVGFWDGSDLIIHTSNVKAGWYQRGQPDYSFNVSSVERWHQVDDNNIKVDVTVYDPDSLQRPYKAVFVYRKQPQTQWVNFTSCEAGNNAVQTPEGGTTYVLPGEPGYQDPDTFGIPEVARDSLP